MTTAQAAATMQVSKSGVDKYKAAKVKQENPEAHAAVKAGKQSAEAAIKETKAKVVQRPKAAAPTMPKVRITSARKIYDKMPHKSVFLDEVCFLLEPYLIELEAEGKKNMATMSPGTVAHLTAEICKQFEKMAEKVKAAP
jgi:hypothetical protein